MRGSATCGTGVESGLCVKLREGHAGPFLHKLIEAHALSLRQPDNRARFLAGEAAYMAGFGLSDAEIALVTARDWTGLLQAGGHLQAILKIAATVGKNLWTIAAHNTGMTEAEIIAACPRHTFGLPKGAN